MALSLAARKVRRFFQSFLATGLTLVERALNAVLEGNYFLVILQISVREPGYSLRELLLYFGRQAEHGFWLLCSNLHKLKLDYFRQPLQLETTSVFFLTFKTNNLTFRLATPETLGVHSKAGATIRAERPSKEPIIYTHLFYIYLSDASQG